jgi:hypothetical protein
MSNALDAFRAQREAVEQVHARLTEVAELTGALQSRIHAMGQDRAFQEVLRNEAALLDRAERVIAEVRRLREQELARFWPGVWKRWAVAFLFGVVAVASFGVGYAWTSRPYDAELESLRNRVEFLDFVAQRVLTMTPAERRQFDGLMKPGRALGR